jgi:PTH1 family peptidyl-tRNA hydrolase
MAANFKLLVGLGNPTAQYEKTRHNAGFWFLDEVAAQHRLPFRSEQRFHGLTARLELNGDMVFLLKPTTYMNRSGLSVGALAKFFRIAPPNILVAHDDLDLPPGVVRLKRGGGHGGHNGLRDLVANLGSADFYRLRFGIGHPGDRAAVVSYVLNTPSAEENKIISGAIARVMPIFPNLLAGKLDSVMNQLHGDGSRRENKKVDG